MHLPEKMHLQAYVRIAVLSVRLYEPAVRFAYKGTVDAIAPRICEIHAIRRATCAHLLSSTQPNIYPLRMASALPSHAKMSQ